MNMERFIIPPPSGIERERERETDRQTDIYIHIDI
jgi:hypothetical protein